MRDRVDGVAWDCRTLAAGAAAAHGRDESESAMTRWQPCAPRRLQRRAALDAGRPPVPEAGRPLVPEAGRLPVPAASGQRRALGATSLVPDQFFPALTVDVCDRPAVGAASPTSLGST
jgi:hypothetical protein